MSCARRMNSIEKKGPSLPHLPQLLEKGARFIIQRHIPGPPAFGAVPIKLQRMSRRHNRVRAPARRFRYSQATMPSRLGR